jgi:hypothetical protein
MKTRVITAVLFVLALHGAAAKDTLAATALYRRRSPGAGMRGEDNYGGLALRTAPWSFAEFRVQILSPPRNSKALQRQYSVVF